VAARAKAWVCGRSLARIAVSNPAGAWLFLVSVLCCQVEVSATGCSLVKRSPTECVVSNYALTIWTRRRSRHTRAVEPLKKISNIFRRE
jgi:hypothetical protein